MVNYRRTQAPHIVQPGGTRLGDLVAWGLLILLLASWGWFWFSYADDYTSSGIAERDIQIKDLSNQITVLEQEREELRLRAAKYERASQVDKTAAQLAQREIKTLQAQRANLHQEVQFLKSLVSGDITVLQLTDFTLKPSESGRSFHYALTVSKRAKGRERVRGNVELQLLGARKGKAAKLSMSDLGIDPKDMVMGFNFFQHFKGKLDLPEGFTPKKLQIKIKPENEEFKTFEQAFDWKLDG